MYKNGQVFLTWNNIAAPGIKYSVYKSVTPITSGTQLSAAQNLGFVADSSGINKRLTMILSPGNPIGLKIDSLGNPLSVGVGLFVATTAANGDFYYAVTTSSGATEDTAIVAGSNSLITSVTETISDPQPVWQQSYLIGTVTVQIYTQFVTAVSSATYPVMTNVGSFPFNFSIYKSNNSVSPLVVKFHAGNGNFIQVAADGINFIENECRLSLDDWLPNNLNSYWFGYHENYDIYSAATQTHNSGTVRAYTMKRVLFTIDWVEKHFQIDTNRVYLSGTSMGAIGAKTMAFLYPQKFAAVFLAVPKFNVYTLGELQLMTDVVSPATGNYLSGMQARNVDFMAHEDFKLSLPYFITVNGKNDLVVGWDEKPPFYDTMQNNFFGGAFYWDLKNHGGIGYNWKTNLNPDIFNLNTAVSYPVFTNCTINSNAGNGTVTDGDSVGTINGRIGWEKNIEEYNHSYKIILKTVDLTNANLSGLFPAVQNCEATVTLRRLQQFFPDSGNMLYWKNIRAGGLVVQADSFIYPGGLISIDTVKIFGVTDTLYIADTPDMLATNNLNFKLEMSVYPNPVNEFINIDFNDRTSGSLFITDILGNKIYESAIFNQYETGIKLPTVNGIYFVHFVNEQGACITQKIVVNR